MSQPSLLSGRLPIPRVLQGRGRVLMSVLAAGLGTLVTLPLPGEMRLIIIFDLAAIAYLGLFVALMSVATPEHAAELSHRSEPSSARMLVGVVLMSLVSLTAVAALQHLDNDSRWLHGIHLASSLLAICLAWMLAHVLFGLHYMRIYYNDTTPDDAAPYDDWMAYPDRMMPDYWDFMYYSFTIAMCYQTSDVTITTTAVRRVTLLHAIFSFFLALMASVVGIGYCRRL